MTAPLYDRTCPVLGCSRRVHVSPSGIVFARCDDHLRVLTRDAFGTSQQGGERRGLPPASSFAPLPSGAVARPAA